jgi:hypothetical protein
VITSLLDDLVASRLVSVTNVENPFRGKNLSCFPSALLMNKVMTLCPSKRNRKQFFRDAVKQSLPGFFSYLKDLEAHMATAPEVEKRRSAFDLRYGWQIEAERWTTKMNASLLADMHTRIDDCISLMERLSLPPGKSNKSAIFQYLLADSCGLRNPDATTPT